MLMDIIPQLEFAWRSRTILVSTHWKSSTAAKLASLSKWSSEDSENPSQSYKGCPTHAWRKLLVNSNGVSVQEEQRRGENYSFKETTEPTPKMN